MTTLFDRAQIDLGNLSVGLATMCVALITLYIAITTNVRARNQVVAEIRGKWIEEMRISLARYVRRVHEILVENRSSRRRLSQSALAELREHETYIALKFDPNDQRGEKISDTMGEIESELSKRGRDREFRIRQLTKKLIRQAREVFATEWDRALIDLKIK